MFKNKGTSCYRIREQAVIETREHALLGNKGTSIVREKVKQALLGNKGTSIVQE